MYILDERAKPKDQKDAQKTLAVVRLLKVTYFRELMVLNGCAVDVCNSTKTGSYRQCVNCVQHEN